MDEGRSCKRLKGSYGALSLACLCYAQIKKSSIDAQAFYAVPPEQLIDLLIKLRQDCQAAEQELAGYHARSEHGYRVEPPCEQDRVDQDTYDRSVQAAAKWASSLRAGPAKPWPDEWPDLCSTKSKTLLWEMSSRSVVFEAYKSGSWASDAPYQHLSNVMSTALLLYRLLCLFPDQLNVNDGIDGYKCVFRVRLIHKRSRYEIIIGEHKGAASVWPNSQPATMTDPVQQEFFHDQLELLTLLFSDSCPHTYDGTVAGSVA